MARVNGIYKCEICGNIVSVIEAYDGDLVSCGQNMKLLEEKTKEEGKEKHIPILKIGEGKVKVRVGSIEHPMEEKHWIELIQIMRGDKVLFEKRLYPGEKPEAIFLVEDPTNIRARELCNIHGLWMN